MPIETTMKFTVHACEDYWYEIFMGDQFVVSYKETDRKYDRAEISFGSIEEMETVAKAMLKACEFYKVK